MIKEKGIDKVKRAFKGVWIPKEIWLDENLSLQEKVFLVEIDSLDNEDGCFATNEYFGAFFNVSADRAKRVIINLKKKGRIVVELNKEADNLDRRVIRVVNGGWGRKHPDGRGGKELTGRGGKAPHNNTEENSTKNITPLGSEPQNWVNNFFLAYKETTGENPRDKGLDRNKYPKMIRKKWPDVEFIRRAIMWAWEQHNKQYFYYWREGRLSLAKLYYRILPDFENEIKRKEVLKKLSDMKKGLFKNFGLSPEERSNLQEEAAAEERRMR
jgi:hypothetical protein